MPQTRNIDHIVYSVNDLDLAISEFEEKLGVRPVFGGYHKTQGTKNALINLNQGIYLELIAIDKDNTAVKAPRWMGIDLLTKPQITRWALKSSTLSQDSEVLKSYDHSMGSIKGGSRHTSEGSLLKWELIMPLTAPEVEIAPFMVDWSDSEIHPSDQLPDMNCKLISLEGTHPNPASLLPMFEALNFDFKLSRNTNVSIKAIIDCPKGTIEI